MKKKKSKIFNESHFHNSAWIVPTTHPWYPKENNNPLGVPMQGIHFPQQLSHCDQEIAFNSSSIMILKMWMSSQTNFFKFPKDFRHFQNVTSNLLHFWSLDLTSLDAMIFFEKICDFFYQKLITTIITFLNKQHATSSWILNFILLCNQSAFKKSKDHLLNPFSYIITYHAFLEST
jgi:hypothetical protein